MRVGFARDVLDELERRKRRLGILGYDDLLTRLAAALADARRPGPASGCAAAGRIVMVDEFQDTDPVQWKVLDAAFDGHATVVLIGDPKQAIYAFRGGDIATYLQARGVADEPADPRHQLAQRPAAGRHASRWCSRGAPLGHEDIVVHPVEAHHQGHRLAGAPHPRAVPAAGGDAREVRPHRHPHHPDGPRCASTSPATSPPTSRRCWPAGRRTTAARCRPATSR